MAQSGRLLVPCAPLVGQRVSELDRRLEVCLHEARIPRDPLVAERARQLLNDMPPLFLVGRQKARL
jgi:hypothetical protein